MIEVFAWLLASPPLVALAIFSAEVLAGLRPLKTAKAAPTAPTIAILVPAHNEADGIGPTVGVLLEAMQPGDRLIVVADNCSDDTAALAAQAGAEVVRRADLEKRGKGFALAAGRDFLAGAPPHIVVVIDADCTIDGGSLSELAGRAWSLGEPTQAINLLTSPPHANAMVQVSNFAMLVKNLVRARGLYRLGGGIPLFGTGMAFPWSVFAHAELHSPNIVEDLNLAIDLARDGRRVHLVEKARVLSPAAAARDALTQRRRWEHGFLDTAMRQALPLILKGTWQRSRHQVALGLDLCVPPLALLILVSFGCALLTATVGALTGLWLPFVVLAGGVTVALALTFAAWMNVGRSTLSGVALALAPMYVLRKIPLYVGFFISREREWRRTSRRKPR